MQGLAWSWYLRTNINGMLLRFCIVLPPQVTKTKKTILSSFSSHRGGSLVTVSSMTEKEPQPLAPDS